MEPIINVSATKKQQEEGKLSIDIHWPNPTEEEFNEATKLAQQLPRFRMKLLVSVLRKLRRKKEAENDLKSYSICPKKDCFGTSDLQCPHGEKKRAECIAFERSRGDL